MRKETLRHIAGAVALVCLSGVSTVDAASVQTASPSARPAITPALQDDDEIVFEPVEKNAEYYLGRRAALQEKLNRLDAKLGDDALKSAERAKLVAEITELHRAIALADDVDFSERWRSLENYSTNALVSRDVEGLESVKKELEAKEDWKERDRLRLVHLVKTFLLKAKIAKEIDEKDVEKLDALLPELAQIAIDDGKLNDALVYKNVASYVDPIVRFDARLGAKAKLTLRRGFYLSKRRSFDKALNVEYTPKIETVSLGGPGMFSYDKSLLDVPQYETIPFYRKRIAALQALLASLPKDSENETAQKLRADVRKAIMDGYEYAPLAVDLIPFPGGAVASGEDPKTILRASCKRLAAAGETERLERLAENEDLRGVVLGYLPQASATTASSENDESKKTAAIDELIKRALETPDNVEVAAEIADFFKPLQAAANTDEKKAELDAVKQQFRDAFKNAESPAKRRLAYLEALQ